MADYDGSTIHIQNGQTLKFTLGASITDVQTYALPHQNRTVVTGANQ